jgi:hypothetical protein
MRWLFWGMMALSLWAGAHWWRYDRAVAHPPGVTVEAAPEIRLGETRAPWRDTKGFQYASLGVFEGRAMVLARRNYELGEFAALAPTDVAIGWRELSDPRVVGDLDFPQMKSFNARFVVPEIHRGSELAKRPREDLDAMFTTMTHVHAIPGDAEIRRSLGGLRPGQVIRFRATLVLAVAPSGARYESSLALGDRNCEVAWFDELELE